MALALWLVACFGFAICIIFVWMLGMVISELPLHRPLQASRLSFKGARPVGLGSVKNAWGAKANFKGTKANFKLHVYLMQISCICLFLSNFT